MNLGHFDGPLAQRFGWMLVHFLWEGAVVALLLGLVLQAMRRCSAQARYVVACAGMALLVLAPIVTFVSLAGSGWDAAPGQSLAPVRKISALAGGGSSGPSEMYRLYVGERSAMPWWAQTLDGAMPMLVMGWACGVVLLSLRLGLGWWGMRRLVGQGTPLDEGWLERLARVAGQLGVSRSVRLWRTAAGDTPMTLGWLRPVILLPAGCLLGLSTGQLEALVAHELAHIRRHDYLVNLLQSVAETLLFYHPAVWWVSAQMRREREHACDDLAVAACGDALSYAQALASLEALRAAGPGVFALAASDGPLLARIRRIVGRPARGRSGDGWLLCMALCGALALSLLTATGKPAAETPGSGSIVPLPAPAQAPATGLAKGKPSEPQVLVEVKMVEIGQAEAESSGLAPLIQTFRQASPVLITNRSGILQGAVALTNGLTLFDHPSMRGVESVVRGGSGVLTEDQFTGLIHAFEKVKNDLLAAPRITTLSGRQARVEIVDLRNIVTGLTAGETNTFSTSAIPVGPSIDVIPSITERGDGIRILVIPGFTGFLGYDDPGPFQILSEDGKPIRAQAPLPRLYASQTLVDVVVPDGQTAMISGFRNLAPLSRTERKFGNKQVVVFITPTLIDATGRRIHEK